MQTRRDQVQAHLFVVGRLVSALVRAEPDAVQTPMRRSVTSTFAGLMIAVVALAGVAVFGLVRPGGKAFQEPGTIIVEKETGSRFLFLDGLLRPVLNIASAKLVAGEQAKVRSVSRRSLAGIPHGGPIGIPGAPDSLPDPANLSYGPWLICAPTAADASGAEQPVVTVTVGSTAAVSALPADRGLLVRPPDGPAYLAWQNHRLRIGSQPALLALGYGTAEPLAVSAAWLNALPAGPDLRAIAVPDRGRQGPTVDGRQLRVGQVLVVHGGPGGDDFYLARPDGLSPLSRTDALLLLGDPASAAAYPGGQIAPVEVGAAAVAGAARSALSSVTEGFPPQPPLLAENNAGTRVPCVRSVFRTTAAADLQVAFVDSAAIPGASAAGTAGGAADPRAADRVTVPPGGGLIAQNVPAPGIEGGTLYLVTDLGIKYPLPSAEVAKALGYGAAAPVPVPAGTLDFLPTGPPLDPAAAATSQSAVAPIPPG